MPAADSALCIAAAEGTVGMLGPGALGARWGLRSELFFLDRLVARVAAAMPDCIGGRAGEPSREGLGEAVVEDVVELSNGVVEERLRFRGDDDDVCSDRLEMELARLSLVLSLPSLLLARLLSLSFASCLGASSFEAS